MMRYQGVGYGKIATATGLSRDSVRNYCIREGLNGYGSELVTEYRKVMKEEMLFVVCLNCGIQLKQNSTGRKRKYCSLSCKRKWENDHRKSYTRNCEYCGKEFQSLGLLGVGSVAQNVITGIAFGEKKTQRRLPRRFYSLKK